VSFVLATAFLVALACALIATPAIICVELRKPRRYFIFLVCFCLCGAVVVLLLQLFARPHRIVVSVPLTLVLMFLPLAALYGFFPGLDVLSAEGPRKILITTAVATLIGGPPWFWYAMWILCSVGKSCI
jgi:xanthine/uracil permease